MLNIMLNRLAVRLQPKASSSAGKRLAGRAASMLALMVFFLASAGVAHAAKPDIDAVYADGQTYYMIGPHMITDPNPNLFAQSQELYIVAYPSDVDPVTETVYAPPSHRVWLYTRSATPASTRAFLTRLSFTITY